MSIYDGNQLPEAPTSNFQLAVSAFYALFVCLMMSLGAFAILAAQAKVECQETPANIFMEHVIRKRNAVVRGALAFIPATYSLAHLYTSSLHNGSLYSAGNVFYVAIFGFAAKYLGEALHGIVEDSNHVDTIKAIYECCYMLQKCAANLSNSTSAVPSVLHEGNWTLLNHQHLGEGSDRFINSAFLTLGCQDDSRLWQQLVAWFRRLRTPNISDYVAPKQQAALVPALMVGSKRKPISRAYASWLYSQDRSIRDFTGSLIIKRHIQHKLNMASFVAAPLYYPACRFLELMSEHFKQALGELTLHHDKPFKIRCIDGQVVQIGTLGVALDEGPDLVGCLRSVNYQAQGLNMACERYICRKTPACAAQYPPVVALAALGKCWKMVIANQRPLAARIKKLNNKCMTDRNKGYWCALWLAYMHMALLGIDLLRLHNNKPAFGEHKACEAGFFDVFDTAPASEAAQAAPAAASPKLLYPGLHHLSDLNLEGVAAVLATVLLAHRMAHEVWGGIPFRPLRVIMATNKEVSIQSICPELSDMVVYDLAKDAGGALQWRSELVTAHSSLPAVVEGVDCISAAECVNTMPSRMAPAILVVALAAIANATIACSFGVFLVAISATVQAAAAWWLLLDTEQIPTPRKRSCGRRLLKGLIVLVWQPLQLWVQLLLVLTRPLWGWFQVTAKHQCPPLGAVPEESNSSSTHHKQAAWAASRIAAQKIAVASVAINAAASGCRRALEDIETFQEAESAAVRQNDHIAAAAAANAKGHAVNDKTTLKGARQQMIGVLDSTAPDPHAADTASAAVGLSDVDRQAKQMFETAGRHHVTLAEYLEPLHRPYYLNRIRRGDVCIHLFLAMAFLCFLSCVLLAAVLEPYYTGQGMCLGRCHNKQDCWANISIGMDHFDRHPECPESGRVVVPMAVDQCPRVEQQVKLSVSVDNVTSALTSGTARQCTANVSVATTGDGVVTRSQPVGSGVLIKGSWTMFPNGKQYQGSTPVSTQTGPIGTAQFQSAAIAESGVAGSHGCIFTVLELPGYDMDQLSQLSGNSSWTDEVQVVPSPGPPNARMPRRHGPRAP